MSTINVNCSDQVLSFTNMPVITTYSQNTDKIQFTCSSEWSGFGIICVFYQNPGEFKYGVLDSNYCVDIPNSVLQDTRPVCFSLVGVNGDTRITSTILSYEIEDGMYVEVDSEPDPTVYEQILTAYGTVSETANNAVPKTRTINGKSLSSNVTLNYSDIGVVGLANGGTGATTADTALSNLGLDHEYGSWTPVLRCYVETGTAVNPTYTTTYSYAKYQQIGNLVYITCHCKFEITATGSTYVKIGGLPFAATSSSVDGQGFAIRECYGAIEGASNGATAVINDNSTEVMIRDCVAAFATTYTTGTFWIGFSGVYLKV